MMNRKATKKQLFYQRYVLTGMALGLYFGLFFRPTREPYFAFALVLALIATTVTLGIQAYQKKSMPSMEKITLSFLQYTILIVTFEARHIAFDVGGRIGVSIYTAISGGVLGFLYAFNALKEKSLANKTK